MARIKRGVVTARRHRKLLELAKGYRMSRNRLVKVATEAVLHAGEYAFAGRKDRKRQFRRVWIMRISAALSGLKMKYSVFVSMLKKENVAVDRKVMAYMAQYPKLFESFVKAIKG